jgi:hypothetical protein
MDEILWAFLPVNARRILIVQAAATPRFGGPDGAEIFYTRFDGDRIVPPGGSGFDAAICRMPGRTRCEHIRAVLDCVRPDGRALFVDAELPSRYGAGRIIASALKLISERARRRSIDAAVRAAGFAPRRALLLPSAERPLVWVEAGASARLQRLAFAHLGFTRWRWALALLFPFNRCSLIDLLDPAVLCVATAPADVS